MKDILHYTLWRSDNDSYWIPDLKSAVYCCPVCGSKLSRVVSNPDFYLKKKSYDVSFTYDGFLVGSGKFLSVLRKIALTAFSCFEVPHDKRYSTSYAVVEFNNLVRIDEIRARPQFGPLCQRCGQYRDIVGVRDYFLEGEGCVSSGIFRTDIEFGSGFEKGPALIVGTELAPVLLAAGLKGMTLDPVISGN